MTSSDGLRWRRAIAGVCAASLYLTALGWLFSAAEEGLAVALAFGTPPAVVGSIAGWWAWRGWAVRPTPPFVVAALGALFGGALTFVVVFAAVVVIGGTDNNLAGLPAVFAAPVGALLAGVIGYARQRRRVRRTISRGAPAAPAPPRGPDRARSP
jgi:hypothetical protein